MADPFAMIGGTSPGLSVPASKCAPVTKSDTVDLADGVCRALLVGTAGTANLIDASGATRANVPLQQGYNPLRVSRVKLSGTADNIWALY